MNGLRHFKEPTVIVNWAQEACCLNCRGLSIFSAVGLPRYAMGMWPMIADGIALAGFGQLKGWSIFIGQ